MSTEITDATFESEVLNSDIPVLVDFWAPWCGPCRMVAPILDRVAENSAGKARVLKLNVDENPLTAGKYGITGIPTVIVFKNGKIQQQLVGVQPEQTYIDAVAS